MSLFKKQEQLTPIFTLTGIILNSTDLIENGISPHLQSLLLPSLATTYGSAIITSTTAYPFSISCKDIFLYLVGFFLSLILYNKKVFIYLLKGIPNVAKCISTAEKILSKQPIEEIILKNIISDFVGMILRKSILKQKLNIRTSEILKMIYFNAGIFIIRNLKLHIASVIILVYGIQVISKAEKIFVKKKDNLNKSETVKTKKSLLNTPLGEMPRRKSSVSSILNK